MTTIVSEKNKAKNFEVPASRDIELTLYLFCGTCGHAFDLFSEKKYQKLAIEIVKGTFPNKKMKFNHKVNCPSCKNEVKLKELYHSNDTYQ